MKYLCPFYKQGTEAESKDVIYPGFSMAGQEPGLASSTAPTLSGAEGSCVQSHCESGKWLCPQPISPAPSHCHCLAPMLRGAMQRLPLPSLCLCSLLACAHGSWHIPFPSPGPRRLKVVPLPERLGAPHAAPSPA